MKIIPYLPAVFFLFAGWLLGGGCKEEKQEPLLLSGNNRWILDSMKVYYYWNDRIPQRPEDEDNSTGFFKSLLYSEDRFSFIINPGDNKTEYSSFAWYGFEYALLEKMNRHGELVGVITLVVPGGAADRMGLKRGDFFTAVNGAAISTFNAEDINRMMRLGSGVQLSMSVLAGDGLQPGAQISLNYIRFSEQPVYTTTIFNTGGRKVGYIFYNQFNGIYDMEILAVLASMRQENVDDLILDLRYNPGGDVSTAAKLAGALSNATADQPFVIYQANRNGGRRVSSFQQTMHENTYQPQSFNGLLEYRLSLNRLFVLTTSSTASAAELLINNLRPYIQVIQIGGKTIGKDMASFAIADLRNPKQTDIVMHPLVFRLYNAASQGDYSQGLSPDYVTDEFSVLPLLPFGDSRDPLIKKALEVAGGLASISANPGNPGIALKPVSASVSSKGVGRTPLPMEIKKFSYRTP